MKKEKYLFTYVVHFRGGTYCTQVSAKDVFASLHNWIIKIDEEKNQIKYLGEKVIADLKKEIEEDTNKPVELDSLKNIWYTLLQTKAGSFEINIVKTDTI